MNNSTIIAANFKTLHLHSRRFAGKRRKYSSSRAWWGKIDERKGDDQVNGRRNKRGRGKREISTTHLSAGSTRWRTCSKPATEEVVYRVEAVASVEEAPWTLSTSEHRLLGTSPFCDREKKEESSIRLNKLRSMLRQF